MSGGDTGAKAPDLGGVSPREVASVALRGALAEIAAIQQRMALRAAMRMHGERALPIQEFYRRGLPSTGNVLHEAARFVDMETNADQGRLNLLYPMVEALEALFRDDRAQREAEFFAAMADHLRRAAP